MIVEYLITVKNRRVLTLERSHRGLSRPYCAIERLHFFVSFVSSPSDMLNMFGYWFLVSVELALVR